ncbi:rootletin isoform X2 [Cherax quadricarinatus]|uniref:rootletin isoform X2 n=1 Tax=Cherax quadricarinatus TaxID=27406 RepID=UPI00387EA946
MGNEGGKITSYDDLYIENSPRRASSLPEEPGTSLDSRIRRLNARRSTSIILGRRRAREALHNHLRRHDDSSDDSGGFRTDFSEADFTSPEKPKLKSILKTRRRRSGWADATDAKFGSHLSVNSTSVDDFFHTIVRSDSAESLDIGGPVGGVSPPTHGTQESPLTTDLPSGNESPEPTSAADKCVAGTSALKSPTRRVNGVVHHPLVQHSALKLPPSPPPRSSSFRESSRQPTQPSLQPRLPPPVPIRSASSSILQVDVHHLQREKIASGVDEIAPLGSGASSSVTPAVSGWGKRRSFSVVENEDQLVVESVASGAAASEASRTDNITWVTPITPDSRPPGTSYTSLTNIDTFVSSPTLEMQNTGEGFRSSRLVASPPTPPAATAHRNPARPQFRKSSDIANLYLYGARGYRTQGERFSNVSTSSDSVVQEAETSRSIPRRYLRTPVPFARRVLTGKVQKLAKRFERSIASGSSQVECRDSSEDDDSDTTSARLRKLFRQHLQERSSVRSGLRYTTAFEGGSEVHQHRSLPPAPPPPLPADHLHTSQRVNGSVGRHDSDLDLLVREGEAVSTRLRNLLTHNLGSNHTTPTPLTAHTTTPTLTTTRRASSIDSARHHSLERETEGAGGASSRLSRADLTGEESSTRDESGRYYHPRARSLTDVYRGADQPSYSTTPHRSGVGTSIKQPLTPGGAGTTRVRRDLFPIASPSTPLTLGHLTHSQSDAMDDPEMYRLEEETRYLEAEVRRLEDMLATSRAERDTVSIRYTALSDHVADEWQEYQKRLEYFHEVHRKQTTLIDRLANKVREYRGRCRELENRATEVSRFRESTEREIETLNLALTTAEERLRASEAQHTFDLETALVKLEDEQGRCESLGAQVSNLQEQLAKLGSTVAELTDERDKSQLALKRLTDEVKVKEEQWVIESQQFNNYYISGHKNLLDLWREIGCVKRTFSEVKTLTSRDLTQLRGDLDRCAHLLTSACHSAQSNMSFIPSGGDKDDYVVSNPSDLWGRIQECERSQMRAEAEKNSLKEKISELNSRISELNTNLRSKERTIQDLNRKLDEGMTEAEVQETLKEKVRTLESYMVEIAQTVIKDSEQSTSDADAKAPSAFRIVRDTEQGVAPDLPQSTVSAVRTALSNRHVQIHELQLKLTSSKDQLASLRKQYESAEAAQRGLEATIGELRDEMESISRQKDEVSREKDRLTEDLDAIVAEKSGLEKAKQTLKSQLETAKEETERRNRQLSELEKEKAALGEERAYLNSKLTKEKEEAQKHMHTITVLNSELSSVQQQVTVLSESLGKVRAAEERLDQEKDELRDQIRAMERQRTELEAKLAHSLRQETDLREALEKVESYSINLGQDKSQLVSKITSLETERAALGTERAELRAEIERLRDDLEALGEERISHETTITTLNEKINLLTLDKEKIELELNDTISERNELHGQLTALERIKTSLESELTTLTNTLTDKLKLIEQLNTDKEGLTKENAEMEVRLSGADKELSVLRESLATLKAEKQSLESFASSLEKKWSNNEARRSQLEKENQQLNSDKERLHTQMNKLQRELEGELTKLREARTVLERRLDEKETEHKKAMMALRDQQEETIDDLRKEKNNLQSELEDKLNSTIHSLKMEKDELELKKDQEISSLKRFTEKLQRERDDSALRFEEEKHRSMMLAQQEIASLEEKVAGLQRDLSTYESQLEQLRRDGSSKAEAGRVSEGALHSKIVQLKEELHANSQTFEKQLKEEKDSYERRIRELQSRLDDSRRDNEVEITSIKTDLRLAREDACRLQQDLEDAEEKLKDAEEKRNVLKKEISRVNDEMRAAEERRSTELQIFLKKAEQEKKDIQKRLDDKESKLSSLEVSEAKHADLIARMTTQLRELNTVKQDAHREMSDLKKKLQLLETELLGKSQELENLRLRLSSEEDRHNESRKEASKLKTKVAEYERERDNLQTELALLERRLTELEDHHAAKEQELASSLEESRANERKLNDEKKNLENYLNNANQQISNLKVKLSREEGHVEALEQQLGNLETTREHLERKLQNVYTSLRTVTRMYQDVPPSSPVLRSRKGTKIGFELSGSHSDIHASVEALGSPEKVNVAEIDPEIVRHELRALMTQMNQVELERDDAVARVTSLERQLSELQESHQKSEARLRDVTRTLSELEEKKRYADDKLNKAVSNASQQEDALRRKESEIRTLNEELSNTRRKMADLEHDKSTLTDRVQKLKNSVGRIEMENTDMKEKLRACEQRATLLDDSKGRLESDLGATKKALSEKQMEIENLVVTRENYNRTIRSLEDQNSSLKGKVEDLKTRMAAISNSESELKDKLSSINRSLKETVSSSSSMQEELSRSQNLLSRSEAERRQLDERVADLQSAMSELKRQKEQLSESKNKVQQDLSNAELRNAELEMTMKSLRGSLGERSSTTDELISKVTRLEQEKSELRSQLADLERKLAISEAEKKDIEKAEFRLEKDRTDLKKILNKYEHDRQRPTSEQPVLDSNISALRIENMELRRKIDDLETVKTEMQQKHLKETLDMSSDHRRERQVDSEKIRRLTNQLEALRQEKERCELRLHSLEQQIAQYREQIREYRNRSSAVAADVRRVRMSMTDSLHSIGTHPRVSTGVLESEIQRSYDRLPSALHSQLRVMGGQRRHPLAPSASSPHVQQRYGSLH